MKRRAACFLLAVLCVGILAGCGGGNQNPESQVETMENGAKRTVYEGVPATHELNGVNITIKDYAVVNQKISEGTQAYFYGVFEFDKEITEADVNGYNGEFNPDAYVIAMNAGAKWLESVSTKEYTVDSTGKRIFYSVALEDGSSVEARDNKNAAPAGIPMDIMVRDMESDVEETEWQSFACQEALPEERIVEIEEDGTITKMENKISGELQDFIKQDTREAE